MTTPESTIEASVLLHLPADTPVFDPEPAARLEMVPKGGHDLLEVMWHHITSHVAPRRSGS